jgi:hypothetical protein
MARSVNVNDGIPVIAKGTPMNKLLSKLVMRIALCALLALPHWACGCPPNCGPIPDPSVCPSGTVPKIVQEKFSDYRYSISSVSACDPVGIDTHNQGVDIDGVMFRAVVGCDRGMQFSTPYAHETVYPTGSETGLAIGRGTQKRSQPDRLHSVLAIEYNQTQTKYNSAANSYPTTGLARGVGNFCFGTNVTTEWWSDNVASGDISVTGSYDGYLETYIPVTYCVPPEVQGKALLLHASSGIPPVRPACSWSDQGGTTISPFPFPYSTFEGCAQQQNDCRCDADARCSAHPYQEQSGGQCESFAWECWCDCG